MHTITLSETAIAFSCTKIVIKECDNLGDNRIKFPRFMSMVIIWSLELEFYSSN